MSENNEEDQVWNSLPTERQVDIFQFLSDRLGLLRCVSSSWKLLVDSFFIEQPNQNSLRIVKESDQLFEFFVQTVQTVQGSLTNEQKMFIFEHNLVLPETKDKKTPGAESWKKLKLFEFPTFQTFVNVIKSNRADLLLMLPDVMKISTFIDLLYLLTRVPNIDERIYEWFEHNVDFKNETQVNWLVDRMILLCIGMDSETFVRTATRFKHVFSHKDIVDSNNTNNVHVGRYLFTAEQFRQIGIDPSKYSDNWAWWSTWLKSNDFQRAIDNKDLPSLQKLIQILQDLNMFWNNKSQFPLNCLNNILNKLAGSCWFEGTSYFWNTFCLPRLNSTSDTINQKHLVVYFAPSVVPTIEYIEKVNQLLQFNGFHCIRFHLHSFSADSSTHLKHITNLEQLNLMKYCIEKKLIKTDHLDTFLRVYKDHLSLEFFGLIANEMKLVDPKIFQNLDIWGELSEKQQILYLGWIYLKLGLIHPLQGLSQLLSIEITKKDFLLIDAIRRDILSAGLDELVARRFISDYVRDHKRVIHPSMIPFLYQLCIDFSCLSLFDKITLNPLLLPGSIQIISHLLNPFPSYSDSEFLTMSWEVFEFVSKLFPHKILFETLLKAFHQHKKLSLLPQHLKTHYSSHIKMSLDGRIMISQANYTNLISNIPILTMDDHKFRISNFCFFE